MCKLYVSMQQNYFYILQHVNITPKRRGKYKTDDDDDDDDDDNDNNTMWP